MSDGRPSSKIRAERGALTPGSMSGKAPKDYGTDRRCACGSKIMRYRKGDRCGLCESNPQRYAARVAASGADSKVEPEIMFKSDKWKSRDYPDGCRECPEEQRMLRRHAGRGLCSKHYEIERKAESEAGELEKVDHMEEVAERAGELGIDVAGKSLHQIEALITSANEEDTARKLSGHDNGTAQALVPPTWEELNDRAEALEVETGSAEPMPCCGKRPKGDADCSNCPEAETPPCCEGERAGTPECYGTECCGNCDLVEVGCDDLIERAKALLTNASADAQDAADILASFGVMCVASVPTLSGEAAQPPRDPELAAMESVMDALVQLDRKAKIRVLNWCSQRYGLDVPEQP